MKAEWKKQFNRFNKRMTPCRQAIIDIFEEKRKHLSAEEVYILLRKKRRKVGMATVYRNLDLLSQMGLLHRLNFGDGKEHYEMARISPAKHHHHLVCTRCGKAVDYSELVGEEHEFLNRLEKKLGDKYDFSIQSHQIYFYGLCKDCR
ncbi:MAG: Fur family transcriptional regulator, ferric uptake regulator [Candidatus Atribacteria bacterium]|nr:Fur family transcriptional regulator, ferric uptake regulator [Candidatus Atribacteria bacterium]